MASQPIPTAANIAVIGCGVAAVVAAMGLQRQGHQVCVYGSVRKHLVTEGISERVLQALKTASLHNAVQQVSTPIPRQASWNGATNAANTERLIDKLKFNQALLVDLKAAGVAFKEHQIKTYRRLDQHWQIETRECTRYTADFIVEARGRSANLAGLKHLRGPETLTFGQNWQLHDASALRPFTRAVSTHDGWLWVAYRGDGQLFTQKSVVADSQLTPSKSTLSAAIYESLAGQADIHALLQQATPLGPPIARGSSAILVEQPASEHLIRIGDAAMAVDPLSGNGIFQSLSSALVAPAVVNTVLNTPANRAMAIDFYTQRIRHLFYRFARIGRDFYALESSWPEARFWNERANWPDNAPAHESHEVVAVEDRPVINNDHIELRKVVVTKDQPLGLYRVNP